MAERTAETRQHVETLRTPFRADIEASIAERGLHIAHVFDHNDRASHQHTLRTITYVVAPHDFQTVAQLNDTIAFLSTLDQTRFADASTVEETHRKTNNVNTVGYNDGLPSQFPQGFSLGKVYLFEPAGVRTTTHQEEHVPHPGMEHVYQAAGASLEQSQTTSATQFVRHRILVYPRQDIAEAVATHLTNPNHPHEGLLEDVAHGHIPTPTNEFTLVPFNVLGDEFSRRMMELSPLTTGQQRVLQLRRVASEILGPHHH